MWFLSPVLSSNKQKSNVSIVREKKSSQLRKLTVYNAFIYLRTIYSKIDIDAKDFFVDQLAC